MHVSQAPIALDCRRGEITSHHVRYERETHVSSLPPPPPPRTCISNSCAFIGLPVFLHVFYPTWLIRQCLISWQRGQPIQRYLKTKNLATSLQVAGTAGQGYPQVPTETGWINRPRRPDNLSLFNVPFSAQRSRKWNHQATHKLVLETGLVFIFSHVYMNFPSNLIFTKHNS